jgi:ABC1 atypical kinase-like domain
VSDTGFPLDAGDAGDAPPKGDGISGGRLRRTAPLAALSARTAGEAVVVGLRSKLTGTDSTEFHVRTAERYAELLGRSKGALMKAGQMLSFASGNPAIPAEFQAIYQAALTRLRDDAPPIAPELSRAVLERELARPTENAFAQFDWEPLAAASIGQVHAARLHDGRAVTITSSSRAAQPSCAAVVAKRLVALADGLLEAGLRGPLLERVSLLGVASEAVEDGAQDLGLVQALSV